MKLSLQIAAGILIAACVIGLAKAAVDYYQLRQLEKFTKDMIKDAHNLSEKIRIDRENKKLLAEKKAEAVRLQEQQLMDQQAKRLADERAMDQAFQKAYQPPANCTADVKDAEFVECVNHKMLAKQKFASAWQGGVVVVGPSTP